MDRFPLISVIVPIYKVEQYLDRCVESIVNQTYENLEIILVDDGSPDNCPAMCDAWAAKDCRIKVIHKTNGGLSDARNAGMAVVSGELMGFVDSDDWISPDMYQLLYENMVDYDSDISACGVEMVFEDDNATRLLTKSGNRVLTTVEAMQAVVEESWLKQPVWYKLYKTALIADILFPVGMYHEDVFWTYQAVGRAKIVSVFDKPCYFYLQRRGSIMGGSYSLKRLDILKAKIERMWYVEQQIPALLKIAKLDLWFSCIYAGQMILLFGDVVQKRRGVAVVKKILQKYPIEPNLECDIKKRQRVWLIMAKLSLIITCTIRNWIKIGL